MNNKDRNNFITNEYSENNTNSPNTTQDDNELKVGDTVKLGQYNRKILNIKDNKALIITEYPIGQGRYNNEY